MFISEGCMYYGVVFNQGEQWNDGCDLICACEDEMTGFYRCRDRLVSPILVSFNPFPYNFLNEKIQNASTT